MTTIIRPEVQHRAAWDRLYAGYAAFYKVEQDGAMRDTVWGWIHDPDHAVKAFLALDAAGGPIGLAHYRPFARPLRATMGIYLDDLFVDPESRGTRTADVLIEAVAEEGRRQGASLLRWITADDNYRGRGVYDRLASRTMWVTYDKPL